jgi:hypothetical protein
MIQAMRDEMELVQGMERTDERDSENYVDRLEDILNNRQEAIRTLRSKIHKFQLYRNQVDLL